MATDVKSVAASVPPLVVIVGETASGKSDLAMKLAKQFGGEIIAADSTTVYRGFDIGTAKPTMADQQAVPHHLLDLCVPTEPFSAADFQRLAQQAIADIARRGNVPIMVGGSGLYIDSVLFGYEFSAAADPEQRRQLNALNVSELVRLAEVQGLDTSNIDRDNKRRVIRLIESGGHQPARKPLRQNTLVLGISLPKPVLEERIAARVDSMLAMGLVEEVRSLAKRYGWDNEPMRGVAYREFREYFSGQKSLEATRQQIIIDNRRLAKKQGTWFRRNKSIHWILKQAEAVAYTTTLLNK